MESCQNLGGGWLADYGLDDEVTSVDFIWPPSVTRTRVESCAAPGTKACREKMRRDRLNDRFAELCSILDPGKPPKADKVAILTDANRLLKQLRLEAQKLKESNEALQVSIKNLKAEKVELRDEKVRLKAEKERMEKLLRCMNIAPPPLHSFQHAVFSVPNKAIPYPTYKTPMGMWQWIPPAALDTSQDHVLRPPVA
ncbi:transcription factor ILR3-like isoform X2 [Dioscorea cayenensis subsp. rotundata]|uniref:Transcription factor ILR3-like isoform X2 n=1 Tax=Dioscorea cayennensis subsp. rotundata TaxID=55577 RepID=A0AB40BNI6_DIOCR|nr:transcription factor ILR3-like isoform X2 [Dioscorea cayenensis subsp. rotundata]